MLLSGLRSWNEMSNSPLPDGAVAGAANDATDHATALASMQRENAAPRMACMIAAARCPASPGVQRHPPRAEHFSAATSPTIC